MRIESFISGHLGIGMITFHHIIIYDNGKCTPHYLIIYNRYNLSFGKNTDQFLNLFVCPEHIFICIYAGKRLGKLCVVFNLQISKLYFVNLLLSRFHNFVKLFFHGHKSNHFSRQGVSFIQDYYTIFAPKGQRYEKD